MRVLLDTCYVPAEPEQSDSYKWLGLLIAVTVIVIPWMLALMLIVQVPAVILAAALVIASFAAVILAAVMADR